MLPIVYTPTVGEAIERYSHEYRRPHGVYLSVNHPEDVEESLRNYGLAEDDVGPAGGHRLRRHSRYR
jgi:malate dehydrogenase (oxaloacetate-decarboxylating)